MLPIKSLPIAGLPGARRFVDTAIVLAPDTRQMKIEKHKAL